MFDKLRQYWLHDLLAALNTALVALPLGLGIAVAGGLPPISGVISAIVGGILCSFFGSSKLAITGAGNSLIVVVISSLLLLKPHGDMAINYLFAAFIMSGIFLIGMGFLRLGKLGDNFPSMVVMGLLAGIGIIIIIKQLKPGLGASTNFELSTNFFQSIHPTDAFVFFVSIAILVIHEITTSRWIKVIPGPVWVLCVIIPFVLWKDLLTQDLHLFSRVWTKSDNFFVEVPNIFKHKHSLHQFVAQFPRPDFGIINTWLFWQVTIAITLVSSLESMMSAKGVEKLDPLQRKVNLNRELGALGLATVVSGFLGGMPVNTVIARSSVNINSGAKSIWSNFFHAILLLLAILYGTKYLNYIPFGALAGILAVTGFKLTKPKVFKDAQKHGWEQLSSLVVTLLATCFFGLISGVLVGIFFNLILHLSLFDGNYKEFFNSLFRPKIEYHSIKNKRIFVQLHGVLNFLNIQPLERLLNELPMNKKVTLDFSQLKLVDLTVLEYVTEYSKTYAKDGGKIESVGLDAHFTTSQYPHALHYLRKDNQKLTKVVRKTERQLDLAKLAFANDWKFETAIVWETPELNQFEYFKKHPIEYTSNVFYGEFRELGITWEISDMTFVQGIFIEKKELHTTEHLIRLPIELPKFILDKEFLYDKLVNLVDNKDVDFEEFPEFSRNFVLISENKAELRKIFTESLIDFLELNDVYHIECIGKMLLIFKNKRLASVDEITNMIEYSKEFCEVLLGKP